jgi:hypothetical protein
MKKRKGAILLATMLVLFLILALVLALFYVIQNSQSTTTVVNERQIKDANGYSVMKYIKADILNSDMGNYRLENSSTSIDEQLYNYNVVYDEVAEDTRKYLMVHIETQNPQDKTIFWKGFFSIPILDYSHFVINPDSELGTDNIRESNLGVARANKVDNDFLNIDSSGTECGKPYIYLNEYDIDSLIEQYKDVGVIVDVPNNPHNVDVVFYDNQTISIDGILYNMTTMPIIIKTASENQIVYVYGRYATNGIRRNIIIPDNVYINLVTDSRIVISSEIYQETDACGLFLMTSHVNTTEASITFDINQYIYDAYYNQDGTVNVNSFYYGLTDGIIDPDTEMDVINLSAIFYTPNGSWGIMEKTFNHDEYNSDIVNTFYVRGGIIEYNSGYEYKHFDDVPDDYYHLTCELHNEFRNKMPNEKFDFPIMPCSKTFLFFNDKVF